MAPVFGKNVPSNMSYMIDVLLDRGDEDFKDLIDLARTRAIQGDRAKADFCRVIMPNPNQPQPVLINPPHSYQDKKFAYITRKR
jgi:hypothetical protein